MQNERGRGVRVLKFAVGLATLFLVSARGAEAKCVIKRIAELPVTMRGLRPLVPAEINGTKVDFVVDSGAFFSTISLARAKELKLPLNPTSFNFRLEGVGGEADSYLTTVRTFTLAGTPLANIPFLVASTGGDNTAGLLGQNVLGLGDVEYDLPHGTVRLYRPEDCSGVAMVYWAEGRGYSAIPIHAPDERNRHTQGDVYINGKRITATFDTGASTSVLTRRAAERAGIDVSAPNVRYLGETFGVGARAIRTWIVPVTSFKIGDEEIRNTQIEVADLNSMIDTDMLLGADFFISHRVWVSNSQRKLYLTYEGGPVFNLKGQTLERQADNSEKPVEIKVKDEEPTDADGYARRGAARQTRNDLDGALADINRAIELAPSEPKYLVLRARVHIAKHQPFLVMADYDQALKLKPDDVELLVDRGALKLVAADPAGALADLDSAEKAAPKESDFQLQIGELYGRAEQFDRAIDAYDKWLAAHNDDARAATALNGRCWARAQLGQDLDKALKDCDRALRLAPKTAVILDARGLVQLRRGENEAAIADYDAALAANGRLARALYGRGLAKLRLGRSEEGKADLAAALALNPKLKELFIKRGVVKDGEL